MKIPETVLCYILNKDNVLFLERNKKKNDYNEAKFIGIGGHIEDGETPLEAVKREVFEETGYVINDFTYHGTVQFYQDDFTEIMHLFTTQTHESKLIDCNEGTLHWVNKSEINNLNMWEGDYLFLNKMLSNNNEIIKLHLYYDHDKLVSYKFEDDLIRG